MNDRHKKKNVTPRIGVLFVLLLCATLVSIFCVTCGVNNYRKKEKFEKYGLVLSNISKYSITIELTPREKLSSVIKNLDFSNTPFKKTSAKLWDGLVSSFKENPNIFLLVSVEGDCKRVIPFVFDKAIGRKVFTSFLAPDNCGGEKLIIEVWNDESFGHTFNQGHFKSSESDPIIAIPVTEDLGSLTFVCKHLGKVTIKKPDFVGQFEGIIPSFENEINGNIIYTVNLDGQIKNVPIGTLTLKNLGKY